MPFFTSVLRRFKNDEKKSFAIFSKNIWQIKKQCLPLHRFSKPRVLSSAGSEHLPYKQRVGGSNPSAPTTGKRKS